MKKYACRLNICQFFNITDLLLTIDDEAFSSNVSYFNSSNSYNNLINFLLPILTTLVDIKTIDSLCANHVHPTRT